MNKLTAAQRKALEIASANGDKGISKFDAKPVVISALQQKNLIAAYHLDGGGVRYQITGKGAVSLK